MSQEWRYGHFENAKEADGTVQLDSSGHPVRIFHPVGEALAAPLATVARVQFGPDLEVPKDRQQIPTDFPQQRVALTADRIYRLVETGELSRWTNKLGYTVSTSDKRPGQWTPDQWRRSEYYADQLQRWLRTEAKQENVTYKWDAIRLALHGIVNPGFMTDPVNLSGIQVHPYFPFHTDHPLPDEELEHLAAAYRTPSAKRPEAVVSALHNLLSDQALRSRAVRDELLFELDDTDLTTCREAIALVLSAAYSENSRRRP